MELKFIHYCMEKVTGNTVEGVVVDTMGINGRKKSILASYHGRYHTIGMAVGKLLREEPTLGRVMASKKHIYVDCLNVGRIVEDFGHLILYNVRTLEEKGKYFRRE